MHPSTYLPAPSLLQPCTEIHRTESDTQSLHNTQTHYYPASHVHCIYNEEYSQLSVLLATATVHVYTYTYTNTCVYKMLHIQ